MQLKEKTHKGLYIKNYGCQMNVYDGDRMHELLSPLNYKRVDDPNDAELIILNTCHIREKATEKIYSELGRLKKRFNNPKKNIKIAVAGCVAQAEGEELVRRAPLVDLVFGPLTYHQLPEMIQEITDRKKERNKALVNIEFPERDKFLSLPERANKKETVSAFLSVQEGCDKFCTFCVVPYTRGVESSRPAVQIISEAKELINNGAKEIILLGQNVNAWNGEGLSGNRWDFSELIKRLSELNIDRLRFTTSHPKDMNNKLIRCFFNIPKLQPYLHLPVQSGSNKILKAMNRGYSKQQYIEIIEKIRDIRPDIAISGDFIVGFPGETEDDFNDTMDIIKKVKYAHAYSFKYSPRPGTPAASMDLQIDEETKRERLFKLQELITASMKTFNESFLGRTLEILVEKQRFEENQISGRSPYLQSVHMEGHNSLIGELVNVDILKIRENSLLGTIV
jgi:tRNA-2-methylthio-N6-dimethylallyladenosine synthase